MQTAFVFVVRICTRRSYLSIHYLFHISELHIETRLEFSLQSSDHILTGGYGHIFIKSGGKITFSVLSVER